MPKRCQEIKESINLVEHIEYRTHTHFKKEGSSLRLEECPFCGSHSGFYIKNTRRDLFQCFACGKKGSIIDFERFWLNCPVSQAIKALVAKYNLADTPLETLPQKPAKTTPKSKEQNNTTLLARQIWENSKPLEIEKAIEILKRRGFGKFAQKAAGILVDIARVNEYKGNKTLVISQTNPKDNTVVGLHKIGKDLHSKRDLGKKSGIFIQSFERVVPPSYLRSSRPYFF
jgi:hypothetical protein